MPKTLENINKVSFLFFAALGIVHILGMLMTANNYTPEIANLLYKIFDLPFLLAALIYGGSAFQIGLYKIGLRSGVLTTILITLLGFLFLAALYINFFFPDL